MGLSNNRGEAGPARPALPKAERITNLAGYS
jgi:hypothetical protein